MHCDLQYGLNDEDARVVALLAYASCAAAAAAAACVASDEALHLLDGEATAAMSAVSDEALRILEMLVHAESDEAPWMLDAVR